MTLSGRVFSGLALAFLALFTAWGYSSIVQMEDELVAAMRAENAMTEAEVEEIILGCRKALDEINLNITFTINSDLRY